MATFQQQKRPQNTKKKPQKSKFTQYNENNNENIFFQTDFFQRNIDFKYIKVKIIFRVFKSDIIYFLIEFYTYLEN